MRKNSSQMIYLAVLSLLLAPLVAEEPLASIPAEDEIAVVDHLIEATTEQLETQKKLKSLMLELRDQEDRFFEGDQSIAHATKMVKTAAKIQTIIKEKKLEHLFSSEYLQELALFSSIANKSAPARP